MSHTGSSSCLIASYHFFFFKNADLQTTQSAMDGARKYYDTLKPICVQVQVTFEDRDRLSKEIEALQEAHSLLDQPKNESWMQRNEELTSDEKNVLETRCSVFTPRRHLQRNRCCLQANLGEKICECARILQSGCNIGFAKSL